MDETLIEAIRKARLVEGCKAIDADLGKAVEDAFRAGFSADQVHTMLSAEKAVNDGPAMIAAHEGGE